MSRRRPLAVRIAATVQAVNNLEAAAAAEWRWVRRYYVDAGRPLLKHVSRVESWWALQDAARVARERVGVLLGLYAPTDERELEERLDELAAAGNPPLFSLSTPAPGSIRTPSQPTGEEPCTAVVPNVTTALRELDRLFCPFTGERCGGCAERCPPPVPLFSGSSSGGVPGSRMVEGGLPARDPACTCDDDSPWHDPECPAERVRYYLHPDGVCRPFRAPPAAEILGSNPAPMPDGYTGTPQPSADLETSPPRGSDEAALVTPGRVLAAPPSLLSRVLAPALVEPWHERPPAPLCRETDCWVCRGVTAARGASVHA